jgi:hypothetical protein
MRPQACDREPILSLGAPPRFVFTPVEHGQGFT